MANLVLNGKSIDSIDDIAENFVEADVIRAFCNGSLASWLEEYGYEEELERVRSIKPTASSIRVLAGISEALNLDDDVIAKASARREDEQRKEESARKVREEQQRRDEEAARKAREEQKRRDEETARKAREEQKRRDEKDRQRREREAREQQQWQTVHSYDCSADACCSNPALFDRVRNIIVEQLGVNVCQVTPDASFIDDLGADSLDSVELIMAFEEEFGVACPEEDAEKLTTVGKVVNYLQSKGY